MLETLTSGSSRIASTVRWSANIDSHRINESSATAGELDPVVETLGLRGETQGVLDVKHMKRVGVL